MGNGISAGIAAGVEAASKEELTAALASLTNEERSRLVAALSHDTSKAASYECRSLVASDGNCTHLVDVVCTGMTASAQEYLNRRGSILWIPAESEPFDPSRTLRACRAVVEAADHVTVHQDAAIDFAKSLSNDAIAILFRAEEKEAMPETRPSRAAIARKMRRIAAIMAAGTISFGLLDHPGKPTTCQELAGQMKAPGTRDPTGDVVAARRAALVACLEKAQDAGCASLGEAAFLQGITEDLLADLLQPLSAHGSRVPMLAERVACLRGLGAVYDKFGGSTGFVSYTGPLADRFIRLLCLGHATFFDASTFLARASRDHAEQEVPIEHAPNMELSRFAAQGDVEACKRIIQTGLVDVNWMRPPDGFSALHLAVEENHIDVVKLLLDSKANPRLETKYTQLSVLSMAHPGSEALELLKGLTPDMSSKRRPALDNPSSVNSIDQKRDEVRSRLVGPIEFATRAQQIVRMLHISGHMLFADIDEHLTVAADARMAQVLRHLGVIRISEDLQAKIDAGELLEQGSEEEVELRAATVYAGELVRLAAGMCRDASSPGNSSPSAFAVETCLRQMACDLEEAGLLHVNAHRCSGMNY